jgi:hypothetical protein
MSSALSMRLARLEKRASVSDPLQLLTDEELQEAMDAINAQIEARVGMPADEFCQAPMGESLSPAEVESFVAAIIRSRPTGGASHDH